MNKSTAMRIVNEHIGGRALNHSNTSFSNINTHHPVWWLNIRPHRFKNELHILLAKNPGLIWLRLDANAIPNPESVFRVRADKGLIDLEIAVSGNLYLKDVKSGGVGYDFRPHVAYEWDDDLTGNPNFRRGITLTVKNPL